MQASSASAPRRALFIGDLACQVLCALMALACACTVYLSLALSGAPRWPAFATVGLSLAVAAAIWAAAWRAAGRLSHWAARVADAALFWPVVGLGLVARLAYWAATLPAAQVSDGLSYWRLATMLAQGQPYFLDGHAFWPPGTPLLYAPLVLALGEASWLPLLVNLGCFVLCAVAMWRIVVRLGLAAPVAVLAVLLLALWPSLVMAAGQVSKETVLIALLCASFSCLLAASAGKALLGGLLAGLCILTQPSLLLMPALFGVALLCRVGIARLVLLLAVFTLGMTLAVAPWSYRNFTVFGELVPVSTNAGLVFHAGNQDAMVRPVNETGGFIMPPVPAEAMRGNDLEMSRWHAAQAWRFVQERPGDFAFLTFKRVILILGDDSDSAYRSLRLTGKASNVVYATAKALSNGWWLLLAGLLSVCCWKMRARALPPQAASVVAMATVGTLYALAVNGLAEGAARHHMAWIPFYALTVGVALWPGPQPGAGGSPP